MITKNLISYEKWRIKKIIVTLIISHVSLIMLIGTIISFIYVSKLNSEGLAVLGIFLIVLQFPLWVIPAENHVFKFGYVNYSKHAKKVMDYNEKVISSHRSIAQQMQKGIDLNFSKDLSDQYGKAMRLKDDLLEVGREPTPQEIDNTLDGIIDHLKNEKGILGMNKNYNPYNYE